MERGKSWKQLLKPVWFQFDMQINLIFGREWRHREFEVISPRSPNPGPLAPGTIVMGGLLRFLSSCVLAREFSQDVKIIAKFINNSKVY